METRGYRVTKAFTADLIGEFDVGHTIPVGAFVTVQEWMVRSCFGLKTAHFQFDGKAYHAPANSVYESLEEVTEENRQPPKGESRHPNTSV